MSHRDDDDRDTTRDDEREADITTRLHEVDRLLSCGFLAGGIAHEINNALTSMRLSLGRLVSFEASRRPQTEERKHRIELLQDIREGVARIERIARELKAFAHDDDDQPVRAIDVVAELGKATALVAHEIHHRAQLVASYEPVPPVRASGAALRKVFVNLLLNSIQSIPEGAAHTHEIRVATRTDANGRIVIEVADTGSGIPRAVANRIFEPFFTTSPSHTLGLGLTIARDVIAALDGEIMIDSIEGTGTIVRIVLPPTTDAVAHEVAEPLSAPTTTTVRRRILIIDDDRPVAAAIAFELAAHDVVVAESGREALELLRREASYDLILCDLMMPDVTGMDVYKALSTIAPEMLDKVVLMTGGAFTAQARQFIADVNAPLLEKPFHTGQLVALVDGIGRHAELPSDVPRRPAVKPPTAQ
jgi:two-component system, cell cycle sensor histidine kinase and response regulator CckA